MAVHVMMFMGMAPFGSFLAGVVAAKIGAPGAIAAGGAVCMAGSALFMAHLPSSQLAAHRPTQTQTD
jgi:hypothetical protein